MEGLRNQYLCWCLWSFLRHVALRLFSNVPKRRYPRFAKSSGRICRHNKVSEILDTSSPRTQRQNNWAVTKSVTRGRGDAGTRGLGDVGTRGLGDAGTWGRGTRARAGTRGRRT